MNEEVNRPVLVLSEVLTERMVAVGPQTAGAMFTIN
jgi:hypothetical protein